VSLPGGPVQPFGVHLESKARWLLERLRHELPPGQEACLVLFEGGVASLVSTCQRDYTLSVLRTVVREAKKAPPFIDAQDYADAECEARDARIAAARELAWRFGMIDGEHHKQWVIDQMLRALLADGYDAWVAYRDAQLDDGEPCRPWGRGVAP
jgi:hypothetical protein